MRTLTLFREKRMNGAGAPFVVCIDGRRVGTIENGGTFRMNIDFAQHFISVFSDMGDGRHSSTEYVIHSGNNDCSYRVFRKIKLVARNDIHLEEI